MFLVENSLFEIAMDLGLANFTTNNSPPIFIFIRLISVLSSKILKYSSISFESNFNQKTKEKPFSNDGKSVS